MIVYCRSCNRDVTVSKELEDSYVERTPKGRTLYHAKRDCDLVNYFNGDVRNIKPEIQRKDFQ